MSGCVGSACDFSREYELASSQLLLDIERRVQGGDYGATSWTTGAQADMAAAALRLGPGVRLLEIGAGAGWPALRMSAASGCDAVLTEPVVAGLRHARSRASRDGMAQRCGFVAAGGAALPFAGGAFDAIHHSDVLCCMRGKRRMLQECRRVAREGGRMAFFVISLDRAPGDETDRELLRRSGPAWPGSRAPYRELLGQGGWNLLEHTDVTAEFDRCLRALLRQHEVHASALAALLGAAELSARLERRRSTLDALQRGLLRREFFLAVA